MRAHTKAHLTKKKGTVQIVVFGDEPRTFEIPKERAKAVKDLLADYVSDGLHVSPEEVFADLRERFSQAGMRIKGGRAKEGLTQLELAAKIRVTQGDLSKMENGKRPIGKDIARRLAKALKVDYRLFL